jgi:tetratricopeptide (TPR) repeat protein
MSETMTKYYKCLEITAGATLDEVKAAYRQMAQVWHPDRFGTSSALRDKATEHMKEINVAYDKLQRHIVAKNRQVAARAFEIGYGHYSADRFEKALEYFKKAAEFGHGDDDADYWTALAYHKSRSFGTAMPYLEKARKRNPKNADILFAIAINYSESGLSRSACEVLMDSLDFNPDHLKTWCKLGSIFAERGECSSAETMYAEAVKRAPTDFDIMVTLARLYRQTGKLEDARYWVQRAKEIDTHPSVKSGYMSNLLHDIDRQIEEKQEMEDRSQARLSEATMV